MSSELIEKLSRIPQHYLPILNHKKDKIAFYWDTTGRLELYIMSLETKEVKQVSHGEVPRALRSGFVWRRDDQAIIFAKDQDGNEQHNLYEINVETSEVRQLTDTPKFQEHAIDTSPDGKYLLFMSTRNGQMNLFTYNFETEEVSELTNMERPISRALWSHDNEFILFNYNDTQDLRNNDIWVMKSDGSEQGKLLSLSEGSRDTFTKLSLDSKKLLLNSNFKGNSVIGVYDFDTNETTWLSDGTTEQEGGEFTPDNNKVLCLENTKATIKPVVYTIETGEKQYLEFPEGIALINGILPTLHILITLNTSSSPSMLLLYNLLDHSYETLISPDLSSFDEKFFVSDEYIEYPSTDDLTIGAILYKPKDITATEKYPALIDVHGGPMAQYFRSFNMFDQILANEGFVVIKPNFRGSTGYGKEFMEMNIKDIGGGDLQDVVATVDYLKTLDYVDSTRIGIYGGSYGGYMTFLATVKKPDLWKAGAALVGITDWKLLYEESMPHFKYYLEHLFGKPEENADLYFDRSPYNFVENLQCPLLIWHGTNDPRCPISQARIYRDKLLELGWEDKEEGERSFEYIEYGDIGHGGSSDQEYRIRTFRVILDFFKRRI